MTDGPASPGAGGAAPRVSGDEIRSAYRWTPPAPPGTQPPQAPERVGPFQASSALDFLFTLSGIGLALFMLMHTSLLSTILGGPRVLNSLAEFLERFYLLQIGAPILIVLALVHIALSLRRAPTTFRQQQLLRKQMHTLWHLDTITWGFQVVSALVLAILISVHLYLTLTDLPITAQKASEFLKHNLWFSVPFTLFVAGHTGIGIYRAAVKWGIVSRRVAYVALGLFLVFLMGLGYTITAMLLGVGGA